MNHNKHALTELEEITGDIASSAGYINAVAAVQHEIEAGTTAKEGIFMPMDKAFVLVKLCQFLLRHEETLKKSLSPKPH